MTEKLDHMYFSQAALDTYQTCPLKFRYRYLDELQWLQTVQHNQHEEERMLGENFHLLAQRYFQHVAPEQLSAAAPPGQLRIWLDVLRERFPLDKEVSYYPEQELRVVIDGARLTAKFDLLAVHPDGRIIIYDWKTWSAAPKKQVRSLQAQVYAMVLCAAAPFGPLRPEDVTMNFWNPRYPRDGQAWPYNEALYVQDCKEVTGLVKRILSTPYLCFSGIMPQEDDILPKECGRCVYAALCFTAGPAENCRAALQQEQLIPWDEIEEIPYEEVCI